MMSLAMFPMLAMHAMLVLVPAQPAPPAQQADNALIDATFRLLVLREDQIGEGLGLKALGAAELRDGPKLIAEQVELQIGEGKILLRPDQPNSPIDLSEVGDGASFIAAPRVLARSGQRASIAIGSEVTVVESISGPDEEGFHRVKFGTRMEGVELSFSGTVVDAGIRLDPIEVKISRFQGTTRTIDLGEGGRIESPTITSRTYESSITLPPDTLALYHLGTMPDESGRLLLIVSARATSGEPETSSRKGDPSP